MESRADIAPLLERVILAVVLPGVAGATNASGFYALGTYTSHVTGHVARIGEQMAKGRADAAWAEASFVGCYFLGTFVTALHAEVSHRRHRARLAFPLLLQAAILAVFATWAAWNHDANANYTMTCLLCIAMGLQNALVTRALGVAVRTTHLTGLTTDLGIELAQGAFWAWDWLRGHAQPAPSGRAMHLRALRMQVSIFLSFLAGALLGPTLFIHYGQVAMAGPCGILLALACLDTFMGIQQH